MKLLHSSSDVQSVTTPGEIIHEQIDGDRNISQKSKLSSCKIGMFKVDKW
jgi:hypothetical protein